MALSGNESRIDMLSQDTDSNLLKTQVNLIRLSKIITNPLHLKQKTGLNMYDIHYILENQNKILEKWKEQDKRKSFSGAHSDYCDEVDIILIEWIRHCKMNKFELTIPEIKTQLINLTGSLKIFPLYYLKPNIWSQIKEILHESNVSETSNNIILQPCTLLEFLKTDGRHLLKPQTYQTFLQTIKEDALETKGGGKVDTEKQETYGITTRCKSKDAAVKTQSSNKADKNDLLPTEESGNNNKNESLYGTKITTDTTISAVDFPPLTALNLTPEKGSIKESAIKEEPLEYTRNKSNTVLTREDAKDYMEMNEHEFQEFIDVSNDGEYFRNTLSEYPPAVCEEIKQESELMVMNHEANDDIFEIIDSNDEDGNDKPKHFSECPPVIYEEIKEEPELIVDDDTDLNEFSEAEDNETDEQLQDVDGILKISNEIITIESNDSSYQEIETIKNTENVDHVENGDKRIVLEIDSDEEVKEDLMEIINKYPSENPEQESSIIAKTDVKQQLPKKNLDYEEPLTVLEIISDSDDEADYNSDQDTFLKHVVVNPDSSTNRTNLVQGLKNVKRTRNEIIDNLPSTSKSAVSHSESILLQPTKKPCTDLTNLTVKSNVDAFKYLHCIKNYFKSQDDKEACGLLTKIMMTFMTSEAKSS